MNVVLIVVDSLRARSLRTTGASNDATLPETPFLSRLGRSTISFRRAYATECWTLPTHLSMFTGLLPSEHGAHFQSMGYAGQAPTIAELLRRAGYHTEVITRNSLFDGTVPGVTRGFQVNTRPLAPIEKGLNPLLLVLALAKPRVRRLIRSSGFFHGHQKANAEFLVTLARMGIPADRLALEHALETMASRRRSGTPYFLFLNLYDVHAPYSPTEISPLRPMNSVSTLIENLKLSWVLPKISSHAYLRPGFRMSEASRRMLLARYHRAIELMDRKLHCFYEEAKSARLLDDTLLVVTSDHGEAFGEHGLYLHDASVYDTHLQVPLWVHHPTMAPEVVSDVVSTRDLFEVLRGVASGTGASRTLLDAGSRAARPAALAEHFHYPHTAGLLPKYATNQAAVVTRALKVIRRREELLHLDLDADPGELRPMPISRDAISSRWRREGLSASAISHLLHHLDRHERLARAA